MISLFFFFSSRRRHTRCGRDWSSDVCSSDLNQDWAFLDEFMPEGSLHYGAFPQGNIWNNANLNYANTDWWDIYYGHSVNQKHGLTISGGADKISYYFSAGHIQQNGILNFGKDSFQRTNLMGKINVAINDKWDFSWERSEEHTSE